MPLKPLSIYVAQSVWSINTSLKVQSTLSSFTKYYNSCVHKLGQLRTASCLRTSSQIVFIFASNTLQGVVLPPNRGTSGYNYYKPVQSIQQKSGYFLHLKNQHFNCCCGLKSQPNVQMKFQDVYACVVSEGDVSYQMSVNNQTPCQ